MRRFEMIVEFNAPNEVEAAQLVDRVFTPVLQEIQQEYDAYGYVKEVIHDDPE